MFAVIHGHQCHALRIPKRGVYTMYCVTECMHTGGWSSIPHNCFIHLKMFQNSKCLNEESDRCFDAVMLCGSNVLIVLNGGK